MLHHIALSVSDPARTATLFQRLLGTVAQAHVAEGKSSHWVVRLSDFCLVLLPGSGPTQRSDEHVAVKVTPEVLDRAAQTLHEMGLEAQRSKAAPAARALYFHDFDNHLFELNAGPLPG